jgi:uncharacterized protein YyaL (SSP411 family)
MGLYAELGVATGEDWPGEVVAGIARYLERDLAVEGGGVASAEDADSEGAEGKFYVWTKKEVAELATVEEMKLVEDLWGLTEEGNFMDPHVPEKGWNVLARKRNPREEEKNRLENLRGKLEERRADRIRPSKDDKVLASWNSLAISGYARAARWGEGQRYATRAEEIWKFLEENLVREDGTPRHRWRNGEADDARLLEDYASMVQALVDLHQGTWEAGYLQKAVVLAGQMLETFEDRKGGGLWASVDSSLIARMKDDYDGAEPSGNAVAALALAELGRLTDEPKWTEAAKRILDWLGERMRRLPQAVPHGLLALQRLVEGQARLVLAGPKVEKKSWAAAIGKVYRPDVLVTWATDDHPSEFVRSLAKQANLVTAYLCEGQSCQKPVQKIRDLENLLRNSIRIT